MLMEKLNQTNYVKQTMRTIWDRLPLVTLGSVLFALCSAPAAFIILLGPVVPGLIVAGLTVAPAWSALLALCADIARDQPAGVVTLLRAVPRFYIRSAFLGLIGTGPLLALLLNLPLTAVAEVSTVAWFAVMACVAGLFTIGMLYLYVFPLLVMYPIGLRVAMRNASLLTIRHLGNTLGLMAMGALLALFTSAFAYAPVLFVPAWYGMFIINHCRMVVELETRATHNASENP